MEPKFNCPLCHGKGFRIVQVPIIADENIHQLGAMARWHGSEQVALSNNLRVTKTVMIRQVCPACSGMIDNLSKQDLETLRQFENDCKIKEMREAKKNETIEAIEQSAIIERECGDGPSGTSSTDGTTSTEPVDDAITP